MSQQRSKTLDWQPVRRLVRLFLQGRAPRGVRWQHWVATLTVSGQFLALQQQRFPSPPQVPFHVEGQRRTQDVRPHSVGRAVVNRTHQEIDALETSERLFHQGQTPVSPHAVGSRQPFGRLTGPDHIDPIQKLFFLDCGFIPCPRQVAVTDRQSKMFSHFVMVDNFADPHADIGRRLRLPAGRLTLAAVPPVRPAWPPAVLGVWPTLLGQLPVVAGHQSFAREIRRADLRQVFGFQILLDQMALGDQASDLAAGNAEIQPRPGGFLSMSI